MSETLHARIAAHTARIAIIGQGYVGLPLAIEFAGAGFLVTGFDYVRFYRNVAYDLATRGF